MQVKQMRSLGSPTWESFAEALTVSEDVSHRNCHDNEEPEDLDAAADSSDDEGLAVITLSKLTYLIWSNITSKHPGLLSFAMFFAAVSSCICQPICQNSICIASVSAHHGML